ncbi:MAG: DUF4124 domain-containing protein [Nitrospirota bacterium]
MILPKRSVARHIGRAWFAVVILGFVLTGPLKASATFQYTDEAGTIHFTDDPGQIPEPIRKRMGIWVEPPAKPPEANLRLKFSEPLPAPDPVEVTPAEPSLWEQVVPTNIRSPWVPGLIGLAMAGGLLVALRASKQPTSRIACKTALVLVIAASATVTAMAALAERGSSLPEAITEAETTIDHWESRVTSPLQDAERRAKEIGQAKREYQETIKQLEALP